MKTVRWLLRKLIGASFCHILINIVSVSRALKAVTRDARNLMVFYSINLFPILWANYCSLIMIKRYMRQTTINQLRSNKTEL